MGMKDFGVSLRSKYKLNFVVKMLKIRFVQEKVMVFASTKLVVVIQGILVSFAKE